MRHRNPADGGACGSPRLIAHMPQHGGDEIDYRICVATEQHVEVVDPALRILLEPSRVRPGAPLSVSTDYEPAVAAGVDGRRQQR
ncbi:hypothetical protein GCM10022255_095000 [Dactylosporangium darangshiense]|uniref:Uncharacterized protein n=1 Tax=Dactylosporangium darangshiense TaxID=579108 RepID=A0ABP8DQ60_9ACTN